MVAIAIAIIIIAVVVGVTTKHWLIVYGVSLVWHLDLTIDTNRDTAPGAFSVVLTEDDTQMLVQGKKWIGRADQFIASKSESRELGGHSQHHSRFFISAHCDVDRRKGLRFSPVPSDDQRAITSRAILILGAKAAISRNNRPTNNVCTLYIPRPFIPCNHYLYLLFMLSHLSRILRQTLYFYLFLTERHTYVRFFV